MAASSNIPRAGKLLADEAFYANGWADPNNWAKGDFCLGYNITPAKYTAVLSFIADKLCELNPDTAAPYFALPSDNYSTRAATFHIIEATRAKFPEVFSDTNNSVPGYWREDALVAWLSTTAQWLKNEGKGTGTAMPRKRKVKAGSTYFALSAKTSGLRALRPFSASSTRSLLLQHQRGYQGDQLCALKSLDVRNHGIR